jgi:hypothetical protein
MYLECVVFSTSSGRNAPHTWRGTSIKNPECDKEVEIEIEFVCNSTGLTDVAFGRSLLSVKLFLLIKDNVVSHLIQPFHGVKGPSYWQYHTVKFIKFTGLYFYVFFLRGIMKNGLSLVPTMRGLTQPLRGRRLGQHVNQRASGRAYLTYAHVRLMSCRSQGGGMRKNTRTSRRRSCLDPRTPPSEMTVVPSVKALLLA